MASFEKRKRYADQAGLMIEQDTEHWCKSGIEYADALCMMSSVLTDMRSDWSTGVFHGNPHRFWMRATLENGVLRRQGKITPGQRKGLINTRARVPECCQQHLAVQIGKVAKSGAHIRY